MANESITFSCLACGSRLTVPADLAGVTGPCPTCQTMIQAPAASDGSINTPGSQSSPAVLRPAPRQLPSRSGQVEPFAKQLPEPNYSNQAFNDVHPPPPFAHRNQLIRFLIPASFVIASVAIGFGVTNILKNQSKSQSARVPVKTSGARPILHDTSPTSPSEGPNEPSTPSRANELPAASSITEANPALPPGLEPKSPREFAKEVLDKFLDAKTLTERLSLIETRTSESELAKSPLASPLPEVKNITVSIEENNAVEQVADFYHMVDFDAGENRTNPQTILVRIRGSADPKVVVDPFLDSYGGRLADYAKSPSDKAGYFQVIVWPLASCYDERVPNHEKKLTLKLLPQVNTKEIALAYFGRQSKIAQILEDGTYSLAYNKAKACTVMLRWNAEDDPNQPYLEAVALRTFDWNP
ncbi:MAG: hypothetical protein V4819_10105 [Verrucomicrobiota bacterium]